MFASLKFIKPLWYFHLDCGENVIWPDSKHIMPSPKMDSGYDSTESMISEASYVALTNGYIQPFPNKKSLRRDSVDYKHSVYDEFRFVRKFFSPFWSLGYLLFRIITLQSVTKSIIAFINTFFIKRVDDVHGNMFSKTELTLKKPHKRILSKTKVRIIIPTYNRYNVLYNVLKDLEKQTHPYFCITIIDNQKNIIRVL